VPGIGRAECLLRTQSDSRNAISDFDRIRLGDAGQLLEIARLHNDEALQGDLLQRVIIDQPNVFSAQIQQFAGPIKRCFRVERVKQRQLPTADLRFDEEKRHFLPPALSTWETSSTVNRH
jgi:hypothetical protein